jgi:hypothetical protein
VPPSVVGDAPPSFGNKVRNLELPHQDLAGDRPAAGTECQRARVDEPIPYLLQDALCLVRHTLLPLFRGDTT